MIFLKLERGPTDVVEELEGIGEPKAGLIETVPPLLALISGLKEVLCDQLLLTGVYFSSYNLAKEAAAGRD